MTMCGYCVAKCKLGITSYRLESVVMPDHLLEKNKFL